MATTSLTKTRSVSPEDYNSKAAVAARRAERVKARKERQRARRARAIRNLIYRFICWLELLPRRVAEATTSFFVCAIVLMIFGAIFFGALGLLEAAMSYWASFIPGW